MTDDTADILRAQAADLHPHLTITRQLLESAADASGKPDQWIIALGALVLAVGQLETEIRGLKELDDGEPSTGTTGGIFPS
jgi:putative AlgH/UPF0301 family transcriptional regulator